MTKKNEEAVVSTAKPSVPVDVETGEIQTQQFPAVRQEDGMNYYVPSLADEFASTARNFITGLIITEDRASQAAVYNYMNNNDFAISDVADAGGVINVVNYLVYPVTVVNEQGLEVPAKRTVLIDTEGKSYGSVSEGVFDSLRGLVQFMGNAPWVEPIIIRPKRIKTRRGFLTMQLRVEA